MANQNILNYYGSKLDMKLDFSEHFDFVLDNGDNIIDNFEHFMLIYQNIFNFAIMVFELYYINIYY